MYTLQRFVLMSLDPVHIGTGGYRLGRVDFSIAREPGTNLPKIPGTSSCRRSPLLRGHALREASLRRTRAATDRQHCGDDQVPHLLHLRQHPWDRRWQRRHRQPGRRATAALSRCIRWPGRSG